MTESKPLRDRRAMLRVKVNSLAEEARIIRREERRAVKRNELREELHMHRVGEVRRAARSATLALGLIKGRLYGQLEAHPYSTPNWPEVKRLIAKYGPPGHVLEVSVNHPEETKLQPPPAVVAQAA